MNDFLKAAVGVLVILLVLLIGIGIGAMSGSDRGLDEDGVAVLNVEGVMIDSSEYLDSLRRIRREGRVKALVVRINSPGGAVAASQEVYEEIKKLGEKIPVVASMGTVAASGGYYVACAAEKIYANQGTVTGSIGVIAQFASYGELLKLARIEVEVIKTGKYKDLGSPLRRMPEEEKEYIRGLMDEVLSQFGSAVSESRKIEPERVAALSDGRIFTGAGAKSLGLVDEIGTMESALAEARRLAGLDEDSPRVEYPKKKNEFLEFLFPESAVRRALSSSPAKTSFGFYYIASLSH